MGELPKSMYIISLWQYRDGMVIGWGGVEGQSLLLQMFITILIKFIII